jgi:hypothetical protein
MVTRPILPAARELRHQQQVRAFRVAVGAQPVEVRAGRGPRQVDATFHVQARADLHDAPQPVLQREVQLERREMVDGERRLDAVTPAGVNAAGSRTTATTRKPLVTRDSHTAWPIPRLPPVTTAVRMTASITRIFF